jgi:hypothetical protein
LPIHVLILILSFAIILAGAEMFTNGVEWVGERLKISEAAVGSLSGCGRDGVAGDADSGGGAAERSERSLGA